MKSYSVLIKESDGSIALCNSNRQDYADLLLSNYLPVKDGGKTECEQFLEEYFDANNVAYEARLYLTIN